MLKIRYILVFTDNFSKGKTTIFFYIVFIYSTYRVLKLVLVVVLKMVLLKMILVLKLILLKKLDAKYMIFVIRIIYNK